MNPIRAIVVTASLTILSFSFGCAADGKSAPLVDPNDEARFSYGVGFDLGTKVSAGLAEDGMTANADLVRRGFEDGLAGRAPAIPEEEMDRVLRAVHRELAERGARREYRDDPEFRALADRNAASSEAQIRAFAARPGARNLEEGVYAIAEANGAGPVVGDGFVAIADWSVRTADGDSVYSGKGERLDPRTMMPVPGRTLAGMRAGDRWSVAFAPAQAYGLAGDPPTVGPNEAIFVDISVISLEPRKATR